MCGSNLCSSVLINVKDLRQMRRFINKRGRPTELLNERIWMRIFRDIQSSTIPLINGEKRRMTSSYIKASINEWGEYEEDSTTDYNRFCMFINEVLKEIRTGGTAYCFYYYQILQLLKFHKDDLRSSFNEIGGYWEVWLEGEKK